MADLLIELKLDNIINGQLIDTSENGASIAVSGPTIVADDTFGSVLSFNGTSDVLTLPAFDKIYSLCLMVYITTADGADRAFLIDARESSGDKAPYFANDIDSEWNKMYVDGVQTDSVAWEHLPTNKWVHLYLEAKSTFSTAITLMGNYNHLKWASGKLSHLRAFEVALSEEDIEAIRLSDLSLMNTYRATLPIDFNMWNTDDEKVLYIENDSSPTSLFAEIRNTASTNIELEALDGTPDSDNYHFALYFRPGVLLFDSCIIEVESDWEISSEVQTDNSVRAWISSKKDVVINALQSLNLEISGLVADSKQGSRSTQTQLQYKGLHYADKPEDTLSGTQTAYLNIASHVGKENIPLHIGFVGSNTILNDGVDEQSLKVRITNTSTEYTIGYQSDGDQGNNDSQFTFSFGTESDADESLLTSQPGGISMQEGETNLSAEGGQADSGTWIYFLEKDLAPQEYIEIDISGIVCDKPTGLANLYVKYEDIPGYWDGQFVLPIEKAPLIFKNKNGTTVTDDYVGIGTSDPEVKLHVKGSIRADGGEFQSLGPVVIQPDVDKSGDDSVQFKNSAGKETIRVHTDGNVGIGTSSPGAKLHVKSGNIRVDGGEYQSWGPVVIHPDVDKSGDDSVQFKNSAGGETMRVNTNGKVGIGTSSPSAELEVNGRIKDKTGFLTPVGGIMMYTGSSSNFDKTGKGLSTSDVQGWAICNGKNSTPNLTDRFIVGAGSSYAVKKTGGANSVKLTESQMPKHKHTYTDSHGEAYDQILKRNRNGKAEAWDDSCNSKNTARPNLRWNCTMPTAGGSKSHENRPPYYAVYYIMKL